MDDTATLVKLEDCQDEVTCRDDDHHEVEDVEVIFKVAPAAKSKELDHHFDKEDSEEDCVDLFENEDKALVLWILVKC